MTPRPQRADTHRQRPLWPRGSPPGAQAGVVSLSTSGTHRPGLSPNLANSCRVLPSEDPPGASLLSWKNERDLPVCRVPVVPEHDSGDRTPGSGFAGCRAYHSARAAARPRPAPPPLPVGLATLTSDFLPPTALATYLLPCLLFAVCPARCSVSPAGVSKTPCSSPWRHQQMVVECRNE